MDANSIKWDNSPTTLYNPLNKDFETTVRSEYTNKPKVYKIASLASETYPKWLANIILNDLITFMGNIKELKLTDKKRKELEKEILSHK